LPTEKGKRKRFVSTIAQTLAESEPTVNSSSAWHPPCPTPPSNETKPTRRGRVSNGKTLFLDGDKGTKAERRFRDIAEAITADLGGADRLSEGQKQLIRRCALISVECEKMESRSVAGEDIDLDLFGTLSDRLGRTLHRLGLRRVPKVIDPPDLQEYLRGRQNASSKDAPGSPPDSLDGTKAYDFDQYLGCPGR
jgi:hypothetical protein